MIDSVSRRDFHVFQVALLLVCLATVGLGQDKGPLDKLDPKKIALTLKPKGTPAEVLAVLGERDGRFDVIAFRPDGGQLATAGPDGQLRLWDLATLKQTGVMPQREIVSLVYSPSGKTLIGGDSQGAMKYWSVSTGRPVAAGVSQNAHKGGPIWALALSPDGKTLYSAGADKLVKSWDLAAVPAKPKATLVGHTDRVRHLAVSADGKWLASTSDKDKTIRLWELGDKPTEKHRLSLKAGAVGVAFAPDGATLAAGCQDGALRMFKLGEKIEEQDTVSEGKGVVYSIAFAVDGKSILALVKWDQKEDKVFQWDLEGKQLYEGAHGRHVEAIAFDPAGTHFVIVNETSLFIIRVAR
jgi:WD40 repeat protein